MRFASSKNKFYDTCDKNNYNYLIVHTLKWELYFNYYLYYQTRVCDVPRVIVLDILKLSQRKDCEIKWLLCFAQISGVLALFKGLSQNFGNSCSSHNRKFRSDYERYARTHVIFVIDRDRLRD